MIHLIIFADCFQCNSEGTLDTIVFILYRKWKPGTTSHPELKFDPKRCHLSLTPLLPEGSWASQLSFVDCENLTWSFRITFMWLIIMHLIEFYPVKPIYWYQGLLKESAVFIAGAWQGLWAAKVQKTPTPWWISGKDFYFILFIFFREGFLKA